MSNPFAALEIHDDEEPAFVASETKVKRTHQEKRIYKQQQEVAKPTNNTATVFTEEAPLRHKDDEH